ncbi:MAG: DUF1329 domain-containing protein [Pseudomonadota bacterium]
MRLIRYDHDYSRRHFLRQTARGFGAAGVLAPLWDVIAATGDISKAYPDELLSIEGYTKGRIKTGDEISAKNVELVKDLLEPVRYQQILKDGRKLKIVKTTTDVMRLSPWEYIEATLKNAGKGKFDEKGNVVNAADGRPWIGGSPFPDARTGIELFAGQTLSWGRHDASFYAIKLCDVNEKGETGFRYAGGWAELQTVARVSMEPKPYWPQHESKLRFQTVFFTAPQQFRGTSFLNVWAYDHRKFPDLYGYVAEFRRVRQFPADQRFEPLLPGMTLFLSDAWAAGDPLLTWGNYKIVGRGPFLAALSDSWASDHPNWEHKTHGGVKGQTYWNSSVELVPEAIIVEAEPTGYPRAPISKKRVWFDARNQTVLGMVTYDRNGQPYRSFDGAYSLYEAGAKKFMDGKHPYWSWCHVTCSDIQTGRVTRLEQVANIEGYASGANDPKMYDRFLTQSALIRLGAN